MSEQLTYESLIKPIPLRLNVANVQEQTPSKTCHFCAVIVPDRRKLQGGLIQTAYERVDLYPDFPELKESSKAGCGLCRLFRKTIRRNWAVRPMEEWGVGPLGWEEGLWDELLNAPWDRKVKIHKVTFNVDNVRVDSGSRTYSTPVQLLEHGMIMTLALEFGPTTHFISPETEFQYGEIGQAISFKIYDSQDLEETLELHRRRLPSTSSLSPSNLKMISTWINDCKSNHSSDQTCCLIESPWLPTRLLDVGSVDGRQLPRLIETSQKGIEEPYAALSHMWGDPTRGHAPPLRTLKANYTKMLSGIPRQMMSKNFVDAVIVTRQLGLRYIWIDSLCIVQDSPEDWHREAATMYKVYKFADVTIVATSATSANDGFLNRQLDTIPATKIGYSLGTSAETARSMVISPQDASETGNWTSDIEGSSWNKRGWTLQERSLSTRMLHFCKTKLYFECRQVLRSEENEPLERYTPRTFEMWPRGERSLLPQDPDAESRRKEILYKRWSRAVTEYSQRRLTKETDKLLAIQVLAADMSTLVEDTYIPFAGMWKQQLKRELLWQVLGRPRTMQKRNIAPSWSWVSVDAIIKWEDGYVPIKPSNSSLARTSFEVVEVAHAVETPRSIRDILKVKAFLKPLAFSLECDNDDRWVNGSRFKFPYDLLILAPALSAEQIKTSNFKLSIADRQAAIEDGQFTKFAEGHLDLDDNDDLTKSDRSLFYLNVDHAQPSGLILERVKDVEGVWKRVGVATVFNQDKDLFVDPCFAESQQPVEVSII